MLLALAFIAGAGVFVLMPLRAAARSTAHFLPHPLDARVHYEAGAETLAAIVAASLPGAVAAVERQQYRSFIKPPAVFVCASPESLASYGGAPAAGGFVLNGRLFVGPKPQNTAERMPRFLAHELSHLHLEQRLGMIRYARSIPSWFKEGLAVLVSSGGGAETVSAAEAKAAITAGHTFAPARSGRLVFEKSGRSYGLTEHMWYRQCGLLVEFLRDKDDAAFRRLLRLLDEGRTFDAALKASYAEDLDILLREFRARIAAPDAGSDRPHAPAAATSQP